MLHGGPRGTCHGQEPPVPEGLPRLRLRVHQVVRDEHAQGRRCRRGQAQGAWQHAVYCRVRNQHGAEEGLPGHRFRALLASSLVHLVKACPHLRIGQ